MSPVAHDAIVVGAGHNGLVCAAYLARAGVPTLLLESRATVGGCASTVDALGARFNICNCDHGLVRATPIAEELDLARHGLRYVDLHPSYLGLRWDGGRPWLLYADPHETVAGLMRTHPHETGAYLRYLRDALPLARLMLDLASGPPTPGTVTGHVSRHRGKGMARLLAWSRRSAAGVLRSYFADDDLVVPCLVNGPVVWGVDPATPGTGLGALGYAMRHAAPVGRPVGGSGALTDAVAAAFEDAGGTMQTGTRVDRLLVERGRVVGVRTTDGDELRASTVVTACDPRQVLLEWLDDSEPAVAKTRARWRRAPLHDGYESKIDAVVDALPEWRALADADLGGADPLVPTAVVGMSVDKISAAHAGMRRGLVPPDPMLLVNVPSVPDPSMRTAEGHHVLSIEVLWTPYALAGGWDGSREPRRWLERWASLVQPGFLDHVRDWRAMTPPVYEREFSMARGYTPSFEGTPLDALRGRPPELTRYRTPLDGLYLCGAGTFPGAGVWGASGRTVAGLVLAAR